MKKFLTLAVALVALAAFADLGVAQQKGEEPRSRVRGAFEETKQPAPGEKTMDKASPQLMKVKVLEANEKTKTFTVMVKGTPKTLNAPDLKSLPKPGDIIEIAVSDAGGGCTDWYDQHHKLHHCSNK